MSKKLHGHYCRICQQHKANEKFSGRGHAAHICKACAKRVNKPPEIVPEPSVFINVEDLDDFCVDIDDFLFHVDADIGPIKPKKKRKPNKAKLLRSEQKKKAKTLLSKLLNDGDVAVDEITKAVSQAGIPTEALRRAKGSLSIRTVVTENGSVWHLSPHRKQPKNAVDTKNAGI